MTDYPRPKPLLARPLMPQPVLVWAEKRCDCCGHTPMAPLPRFRDATGWWCVACYRALVAADTTTLTPEARAFLARRNGTTPPNASSLSPSPEPTP